jgi:hypothetical protein
MTPRVNVPPASAVIIGESGFPAHKLSATRPPHLSQTVLWKWSLHTERSESDVRENN